MTPDVCITLVSCGINSTIDGTLDNEFDEVIYPETTYIYLYSKERAIKRG